MKIAISNMATFLYQLLGGLIIGATLKKWARRETAAVQQITVIILGETGGAPPLFKIIKRRDKIGINMYNSWSRAQIIIIKAVSWEDYLNLALNLAV